MGICLFRKSLGQSYETLKLTSDNSINENAVALPGHGVSLTVPEGAVDFPEEIFLAVMPEGGRDRPRLADNQTLLSPVVLTGPPRLAFKKPVVVSFGHCANLRSVNFQNISIQSIKLCL